MDSALPIVPLPLLAQPLALPEDPSTEGGFDFSALFLGLTDGAKGQVGQDPQDPQAQMSLLFQAVGETPESPAAALLTNSDTLETNADGEGRISHEAAGDLLLPGAGLLQFIPSPLSTEGERGTDLPSVSQRLHGPFSLDVDAEQAGLNAVKAQSLDVPQQLLTRAVSQNVTEEDVTEQDQHNARVLSTRVSLRLTGLRTEPDVPEGIRESQLPLKNIIQIDRTLADRISEQSPRLSRLGIVPSAQGQATPATPDAMAVQQDSDGLSLPNAEFDGTGPALATQEAIGSDLFETQAVLKGLALRGVHNDLEQPQTQQSRQAFAETISVLSAGSSAQDETQTTSVLDAQRAEEVRHNILERVVAEMAARVQLNQREARIQLDPPELGALKIELVVNGEQVQARIVAEVAEVGSLLKNHLSDLKQTLQNQGLDLNSVQVDVSSRGDGHSEQDGHGEQTQQFQHDSGAPRGGRQHDAPSQENHGEGKADEQQLGQAASVPGSRSVNVRV